MQRATRNGLKSKFKSVDKLTPEEIALLMGEKFMKGIPVVSMDTFIGKDTMQFNIAKAGDAKGARDILWKKIQQFAKDYSTKKNKD